jgi:hypothetical protein
MYGLRQSERYRKSLSKDSDPCFPVNLMQRRPCRCKQQTDSPTPVPTTAPTPAPTSPHKMRYSFVIELGGLRAPGFAMQQGELRRAVAAALGLEPATVTIKSHARLLDRVRVTVSVLCAGCHAASRVRSPGFRAYFVRQLLAQGLSTRHVKVIAATAGRIPVATARAPSATLARAAVPRASPRANPLPRPQSQPAADQGKLWQLFLAMVGIAALLWCAVERLDDSGQESAQAMGDVRGDGRASERVPIGEYAARPSYLTTQRARREMAALAAGLELEACPPRSSVRADSAGADFTLQI